MPDAIPHISPGTLVGGKYRLGEVLGEGGMGTVYDGVNETLGLRVAVKVLHPEYGRKPRVVQRFKREARAAASIGHANICEVIDTGVTHSGVPFLVMPRLTGKTLGALLKQHRQLPPERIVDIVAQTLFGLQAAHSAGIVHRDLKPENIFLSTLGDRTDFVKILDFGISKMLGEEDALTKTGASVGTPYYMSPEQAMDSKEVDHRTDLWAAGIILYEALVGTKPFDGSALPAIVHRICHGTLEAPKGRNPSVPSALSEVIMTALSRDIVHRYPDAETMRNALIDALAPGGAPAASRTINRFGMAAAALAVMAIPAWLWVTGRGGPPDAGGDGATTEAAVAGSTDDGDGTGTDTAQTQGRAEVGDTDTGSDPRFPAREEAASTDTGRGREAPSPRRAGRKKDRTTKQRAQTSEPTAASASERATAGGIQVDLNNPYETHQQP